MKQTNKSVINKLTISTKNKQSKARKNCIEVKKSGHILNEITNGP